MNTKLQLYKLWAGISALVNKWFDPFLREEAERARAAMQAEQVRLADEFLRKFRNSPNYPGFKKGDIRTKITPYLHCRHLKGGNRVRSGYNDYNMACHTFPDGRQKIWCLNGCGFVSWNADANWVTAANMMHASTNSPSTSERVVPLKKGAFNV